MVLICYLYIFVLYNFSVMRINYFRNPEKPSKRKAISGKKEREGIPGQNLKKILLGGSPRRYGFQCSLGK